MKTRKTAGSRKRRVLLVDDHPVVREGLAQRINRERDLAVCGEAQSAGEALRAVASHQPDVVVLDLSLPKGHGLELIKDLKNLHPDLPLLVFTMHDENLFAERALRAGARGYVMKQEPPERLLAAVRTVLNGEYFLSDKASSTFLHTFFRHSSENTGPPIGGLTDRELEVFELIGQGVGTRSIADRLGRSVKTIETHRARIMEKLSLKSAAELVVRASRWVESEK
jgi:DNA-binding NarL/FixJ family response regulator